MIDFIIEHFFTAPENLTLALDPITIGLMVGQGVSQVGKMISAKQQEREAAKQAREQKDLFDKMVSEFESGKYDQTLSQEVRDVGEQQRILAEETADQAAARGQASIQSALAATRYGDPRAGALIPRQVQQIESGIQQAELAGLQQKVAADASVASAQQKIDESNKAMQQQLAAMQMSRGAAGMDAANLAAQQAKQARMDALTGLASTAAQGLAMSDFGGGSGTGGGTGTGIGTGTPEVRFATQDPTNPAQFNLSSVGQPQSVDPSSGATLMDRIALGEFTGTQSDRSLPNTPLINQLLTSLGNQSNQFDPYAFSAVQKAFNMGAFGVFEKGGKYEFANKGGEVHMTEGEFSHKTNKKALVDEETGEKEAELTGDEAMVRDGENVLVFNPNQQSTIEALVNKGDSKGLMKKMKALLKKFNKENV